MPFATGVKVLGGRTDGSNRARQVGVDQLQFLVQVFLADVGDIVGTGIDHDRIDSAQSGEKVVQCLGDGVGLADGAIA